jgi:hypothetical protein
LHQFSRPEYLGALAVVLSSDAATSLTGSAFSIVGGWVAE